MSFTQINHILKSKFLNLSDNFYIKKDNFKYES